MTFDEYYNAVHKLLPSGTIWPDSQETAVLNTFLEVVAKALSDLEAEANSEVDDVFPDSATPGNYIPDWERVLQLPKKWISRTYFKCDSGKCGEPLSVATIEQFFPTANSDRRDAIVSFLNTSRLNNEQFYLDLAASLGFVSSAVTTAPTEFEMDVTSGDTTQINTLISLVKFFAPAHVQVTITNSIP